MSIWLNAIKLNKPFACLRWLSDTVSDNDTIQIQTSNCAQFQRFVCMFFNKNLSVTTELTALQIHYLKGLAKTGCSTNCPPDWYHSNHDGTAKKFIWWAPTSSIFHLYRNNPIVNISAVRINHFKSRCHDYGQYILGNMCIDCFVWMMHKTWFTLILCIDRLYINCE